jgi:hypothetical protein
VGIGGPQWAGQDESDECVEAKRTGMADTFLSLLRADPARVVVSVMGILFALALVTLPFFLLHG